MDKSAFERQARTWYQKSLSVGHGCGAGNEEAEDIAQDVMLRLRKPEPTIHDYDKAYTLMAEVEQEQEAVRQQIEQAKQEITRTQLITAGFVPVMLEDGTIIYVEEPKEYFAYEE